MDTKVFSKLEKKLNEFIEEAPDGDLRFFLGDHTAELMARAAAAVFDLMEYEDHLSNRIGAAGSDYCGRYKSFGAFIEDARKAAAEELKKFDDRAEEVLAEKLQPIYNDEG